MSEDAWKPSPDRDPEELSLDQQIKDLLRADPFVDFTIILTSGDRVDVKDPFALAFGKSLLYSFPNQGGGLLIRKNQIVAVETHEPAH